MAEFKGQPSTIKAPIHKVYNKLVDFENFKSFIDKIPTDKIPADKLEQFKNIEITSDSIAFQGGPTGPVKLVVDQRIEPSLIRLKAADLPINLTLEIQLKENGEETLQTTVIKADIPAMLKPMVAGPLQKVVDQFGTIFSVIPFDE